MTPFDPATRMATARRVLVAAGTYDQIAPPAGSIALASAWGVAPILYSRGHMSLLFLCRALRRDLVRFVTAAPTTDRHPTLTA